MLGALTTGPTTMQTPAQKKSPSVWHDVRRDWLGWSPLERLAAGALGLGSFATAALYVLGAAGLA